MILCSRLCRILIITGVISNPHHQQEVEAFEENACYKSSVTNNNIVICFNVVFQGERATYYSSSF